METGMWLRRKHTASAYTSDCGTIRLEGDPEGGMLIWNVARGQPARLYEKELYRDTNDNSFE